MTAKEALQKLESVRSYCATPHWNSYADAANGELDTRDLDAAINIVEAAIACLVVDDAVAGLIDASEGVLACWCDNDSDLPDAIIDLTSALNILRNLQGS